MTINILRTGVTIFLLITHVCLAQQNDALHTKAKSWVEELKLSDEIKETRVISVIEAHLNAVRNWHNNHPYHTVPAGINPRTGQKLSVLERSIIADSSMPDTVHKALMNGLRADLNENQVEMILDKYTVGKVPFTMKAYREIVTDLTEKEEAVILQNLKAAREMAVDYKSMKQISAIFEIYKTKNENYLNANGRSWRQLYKAYGERRKAEKAKKKKN